jgi:hypothetical protein
MKGESIKSELSALLATVSVIAKKNEDFQRRTGSAFNVFSVCGINHYETKHSEILAALLDPSGAHGLGAEFLRSFLENVAHEPDCAITLSATVRTEVSVNSDDSASASNDSRIDILIEDPESKLCVAVESKIYAAEQPRQLERYRSWLSRERAGFRRILLYLTLNGCEPETDSPKLGDNVRLQCASWRYDVVPWLYACARLAFDRPFVRESLLQYANLINLISGGSTMNDEQKLEIVGTATANASSLRGAVELFKHKGAICDHVAVKIAMDLKERLSSNDEWVFDDCCHEPYGQKETFIRLKHVKSGVFVRIAPEHLELWDFFIGFDNSDTGRFTDEIRERFSGLPGWAQTEWWPGWKYLPKVMLNWDGDFLADYLDGDKRRVIDLLLDEVRAIQSLLPLTA